MKILVIGSGGREHALAWRLAQCQDVTRVYVAPGNAGTDADPTLENLPITDIEALADFTAKEHIALTVVGLSGEKSPDFRTHKRSGATGKFQGLCQSLHEAPQDSDSRVRHV